MHPTLVREPFHRHGWVYEEKRRLACRRLQRREVVVVLRLDEVKALKRFAGLSLAGLTTEGHRLWRPGTGSSCGQRELGYRLRMGPLAAC
jgi:hypothetical protein